MATLTLLSGCNFDARDGLGLASQEAALIPREALFGPPERSQVGISPDGRYLAFLAPRNGALDLWVAPVSSPGQARLMSEAGEAPIVWHAWSADAGVLLYTRLHSDETKSLYSVNLADGLQQALTPPEGRRLRVLSLTPRDPGAVLVAMHERDTGWPDVFSIDVRSGESTVVFRNDRGFSDFWADRDHNLRLARRSLPSGEVQYWVRGRAQEPWALLLSAPFEDSHLVRPVGFDSEGRTFLMLDSVGRDRAALVRVNAATGEKTVLGESPRADISEVWIDAETFEPQVFGAQYLKLDWQPLSAEGKADLDYLKQRLDGDPQVISRTRDDGRWIILEEGPMTPPRLYLYDRRDGRSLRLLFSQRPQLASEPLQPMIPIEINARDGLTLVSYLTLPPGTDADGNGRPESPQPLVLLVRDRPWGRDGYKFSTLHQWLANRGYAALSVNFRGSAGFGKAFGNAGNREWGAKMQQDLLDAVDWAVARQVAAPDKVAIFGESYGGYAVLAGLSENPEVFACGVAAAAPADLEQYLSSPQVRAELDDLMLRVGDPRTAGGRALLRERSPLRRLGRIEDPLLLVHGLQDPRVRRATVEQVASAVARAAPLTYLAFPDEGHVLRNPANRIAFYAAAEHLLSGCLGGRAEPFGVALRRTTVQVERGVEHLPALAAALEPADPGGR